jgi:hypothetical protein
LEEVVLAEVLTPEIASLWRKTLTERTFEYKQHQVRYEVGQPMGFLSSWAVFALTHHLIIEYAAHELGLPPQFEEYSVLGDDVCIWNKLVANRYVDLLTELGVPINWNKSLLSDRHHRRIEFAKRIAIDGVEVTGLK